MNAGFARRYCGLRWRAIRAGEIKNSTKKLTQSQLTTKPTSMEEEGEQRRLPGKEQKLFYLLCPLHFHSFSFFLSFYLKIWLDCQLRWKFYSWGFHARINSLLKWEELLFKQTLAIIRFARVSNCLLSRCRTSNYYSRRNMFFLYILLLGEMSHSVGDGSE